MKTQDNLPKIRRLLSQGYAPSQVARELGISRQWVYAVCAKHDIPYADRDARKSARIIFNKGT